MNEENYLGNSLFVSIDEQTGAREIARAARRRRSHITIDAKQRLALREFTANYHALQRPSEAPLSSSSELADRLRETFDEGIYEAIGFMPGGGKTITGEERDRARNAAASPRRATVCGKDAAFEPGRALPPPAMLPLHQPANISDDGETVPAGEKLVSLFEPHADIIVKGLPLRRRGVVVRFSTATSSTSRRAGAG
jgi:hypothetical protein